MRTTRNMAHKHAAAGGPRAAHTRFENIFAHFAGGFGFISHFATAVLTVIAHNEVIRLLACFAAIIPSRQPQLPFLRPPPLLLFQLPSCDLSPAFDVFKLLSPLLSALQHPGVSAHATSRAAQAGQIEGAAGRANQRGKGLGIKGAALCVCQLSVVRLHLPLLVVHVAFFVASLTHSHFKKPCRGRAASNARGGERFLL
jgi:hypothetical protein